MRVLDLFSGIGGMSLGLERAGFEAVAFVELDPYCRSVLARHWPRVPQHDDVRRFDASSLRGRVDLVAGGPPCQAASVAGKRRGHEDERWLWGEYLRVVRDVRPEWLLAENVQGLVSLRPLGLDWIAEELEAEGYAVEPVIVGARDAGAPHERKRVWIVAHAEGRGREEQRGARAGEPQFPPPERLRDAVADAERDSLRFLEQRLPGGRSGGVRDEGEAFAREGGEVAESSRESGRTGQRTEEGRDGNGSRLRGHAEVADATGRGRGELRRARHARDGGDAYGGGSVADADRGRRGLGRESESGWLEGSPGDESLRRCLRWAGAPTPWPSGPGQSQHEWEPPRVIEKPSAALGQLFDEDEIGVLPNGALLNTEWVEVLMGFPVGWTKTHCGTRDDRLRALGNAVVPPVVTAIAAAIAEAARGAA